jgi:hypothetical protein
LQKLPNNGITIGDPEEVGVVHGGEKSADLTFVYNTAKELKQELSWVFLMNSAIPRDAERVTAEEIKLLANEIETGIGGVYAIMSEEFQLPLVRILMAQMQREGKLDPLPKNTVHPTIVTGLDALGRSQEMSRMFSSLQMANETLGEQVVAMWVNTGEILREIFRGNGVSEANRFVKNDQQVSDEQNQQRLQALAEKAAGPATKGFMDQQAMGAQGGQPQQPETASNQ